MFKISFRFLDKPFTGFVQIIDQQPVQYIVFGIVPLIRVIPERLVYESFPEKDQLIYKSFNGREEALLRRIGDCIFWSCHEQKINVHTGREKTSVFGRTNLFTGGELQRTVSRRS